MSELQKHLDRKAARELAGAEYRTYMRWTGRALEVPLGVVVGLALGTALDRVTGIAPWGSFIGLAFGIATAVRFAISFTRQYRAEHPDEP